MDTDFDTDVFWCGGDRLHGSGPWREYALSDIQPGACPCLSPAKTPRAPDGKPDLSFVHQQKIRPGFETAAISAVAGFREASQRLGLAGKPVRFIVAGVGVPGQKIFRFNPAQTKHFANLHLRQTIFPVAFRRDRFERETLRVSAPGARQSPGDFIRDFERQNHVLAYRASSKEVVAPDYRACTLVRRSFPGAVSYFGRILSMPRGNPSPKLAITVDPDVHENILAAAARDRVSVSAWMTNAAREALKRRAGLAAVELWEKQHGRFTPEEMNEARRGVRGQLRTSRTVRRPA